VFAAADGNSPGTDGEAAHLRLLYGYSAPTSPCTDLFAGTAQRCYRIPTTIGSDPT
jgi:hypothetical protein